MREFARHIAHVPPDQQAIRDKCVHPTGTFIEFKKEQIDQSIPERFEQIAHRYHDRTAVKMSNQLLTYGELNATANRVAHAILAMRGKGEERIALLFEPGA